MKKITLLLFTLLISVGVYSQSNQWQKAIDNDSTFEIAESSVVKYARVPGAGVINPVSAFTTMLSDFGTSLNNTINGAGLDAFPSLTANHIATGGTDSWVTDSSTGDIDFDLGDIHILDGFSFWNQNNGGPGGLGSTGIQNVIQNNWYDIKYFT